jgi:hypothetical protein
MTNRENFNIAPLVIEIESTLKKGLLSILDDFTNRYNLLEKTHVQIMKLPSVLNEINKPNLCSEVNDEDNLNNIFQTITNKTEREEMRNLTHKIKTLETQLDAVDFVLKKIIKIIDATDERMTKIDLNVEEIRASNKSTLNEMFALCYATHRENNTNLKNDDLKNDDLSDFFEYVHENN